MRIRVGRFVALTYLFCVLAPAAALAWGSGPAPCLGDEVQTVVLAPEHHHGARQMHADGGHDHTAHAHHQAAAQDAPAQHHHDGKGTPGPCCAMMCASALPAALPDVVKPVQPTSTCAPEIAVSLHSEAPPLLYRPPDRLI